MSPSPPPFMSQPLCGQRRAPQAEPRSDPPARSGPPLRSDPPVPSVRTHSSTLAVDQNVPTGSKRAQGLIDDLEEKKKKKKRKKTLADAAKYKHAAQWYYQTLSLYIPISTVCRVAWAAESNPEDPFLESIRSDDCIGWHVSAYRALLDCVPGSRQLLDMLMEDDCEEDLETFIDYLDACASAARTADTNLLQSKVLVYMLKNPLRDALDPPLSSEEPSKANRGYKHDYTAKLLCPRKLRKGFLRDKSKVKKKMADGKSKVNNSSIPFFCYDQELYEDKDPWAGLFQNTLLIRCARAILFGQSKALDGIRDLTCAPGDCNAKNNGIRRVTPGFIATICCQVHFALSNTERWQASNHDFGYQQFHNDIVDKFVFKEDDDWADDTLHWWDTQVYGQVPDDDNDNLEDSDAESGDEAEQMEERRRECIARKTQHAASAEPVPALSTGTASSADEPVPALSTDAASSADGENSDTS
ncbi:hypothetical protein VKT23_008632 [Stygiomarasmius scandens]|uniref:Uncharacterized protein n=1 Tax=Marasmiellus scandens TaxID=2682957 RepID=A0ABR1JLN4_9AGAR